MKHITQIAVVTALLGAGSVFAGCSSDSNNPGPVTVGDGGSGNGGAATGGSAGKSGGSNGGGGTGNGGTAGASGAGGGSSGGSDAGLNAGGSGNTDGGGSGGATGSCTVDTTTKCYTCTGTSKPATDVEFLNQCTANSCVKFDNAAAGIPATLPTIP